MKLGLFWKVGIKKLVQNPSILFLNFLFTVIFKHRLQFLRFLHNKVEIMAEEENFEDWSTLLSIMETNYSSVTLKKKGLSSIVQKRISISEANRQYASLEVKLMADLDSPYVVKCVNSKKLISDKKLSIYMPYYPNGDLQEYLLKNPNLTFSQKMKMFVDILVGLSQLHSKFVIHRDLKLKNIFVTEEGGCVIGDLGIATVTESFASTQVGTFAFQAPDVFSFGSQYDEKVDIWGLGIIAFQLFNPIKNGKLAYPFGTPEEFTNNVMKFRGVDHQKYLEFTSTILPFDTSVPFKLSYLIQKMLNNDPKKRLSWIQLYSSDILFKLSPEDQRLRVMLAEYKCSADVKQILISYKEFISDFLENYYQKLIYLRNCDKIQDPRIRGLLQNSYFELSLFLYLGMKRMLQKFNYIKEKKIYKTIREFQKKMREVYIKKQRIQAAINERFLKANKVQISKNQKYLSAQFYEKLKTKVDNIIKLFP